MMNRVGEFQNGNCWYTPRLFSYEWQIQGLQVRSLYEWQGKDLNRLCFQRFARNPYERQIKDLQQSHFRQCGGSKPEALQWETARLIDGDFDWQTHSRVPLKYTQRQLLS